LPTESCLYLFKAYKRLIKTKVLLSKDKKQPKMTFEEIKALIQLINKSDLAEFKFEKGDEKVVIRTSKYNNGKQQIIQSVAPASYQAPAPITSAPVAIAPAPSAKVEDAKAVVEVTEGLLEIKSPIVGTFYRSAGPDKPVYAKVGDVVDKGSVVCIVEAMKLFNEIESEVKGKIVKVVAEDAMPVEYDQVLFLVDPKG
jgi:acetyl-CoA carboxylase biotin carboxyl carrier protein